MKYFSGSLFIIALYSPVLIAREIPSPPQIIKQPPTNEVFLHEDLDRKFTKPLHLECEATGEPAPKYYWVKNGKPFPWQLGTGNFSISKPSEVDFGQYQCFAENQYGTAASNSVFVRKSEFHSFNYSQPLTLTAKRGEPYKLTCQSPDGFPKPIIHWMYFYTNGGMKSINSTRITVDPEGNLWFSNLTIADTADNFMYVCVATSIIRSEYKLGTRVVLNVNFTGISASQNKFEPVLQYVTRKNEVAYKGKRAELFCIFGGTPLPETVWTKNGKLIHFSDRIKQGNYGKSLVIKVVDLEDEGSYTCEVSNGVGEAKSYSINLKVLAVPYFTKEPERVIAAEDETVEFVCEAGGIPEPEIKWIQNGQPIAEANPRRKVYKNRIVIEGLVKNDTGNYGCNATNSLGYVYKDVYVNVLAFPPEVMQAPRDTKVVAYQDVNITCTVLGVPKANIKWFHNGEEFNGERREIQPNGNLYITFIEFTHGGNYTCFAYNKLGNISATANIKVKAPTYIVNGPEDQQVEAQTSVTFRCNAVTDPSHNLEIVWLKDDQPIDFEEKPRFMKLSDNSLVITKTIDLDSGTYTCLAKSELDKASAKAHLRVQDVPDQSQMSAEYEDDYSSSETLSFNTTDDIPETVKYLEAIPLGSVAFLLKWQQPDNPNGVLTGYNIYYDEVDYSKVGPTRSRHPQLTDPNITTAKLGGLKPQTSYRIYISATSRGGESKRFFIESSTKAVEYRKPGIPNFEYDILNAVVSIRWIPNESNPGSHFFVKYRKKGDPDYHNTPPEEYEDFLVVQGLDNAIYEFLVVSVDGTYQTESDSRFINLYEIHIIEAR